MPIKLQTVAAVAVFTALNVAENYKLRKKYNVVARAYLGACDDNELLKEKCKYLFHLLDKHDVPVDEFDLIALTHDIPQD